VKIGEAPPTGTTSACEERDGHLVITSTPSVRKSNASRPNAAASPPSLAIFKSPFDIIADKLRGYVGLRWTWHAARQVLKLRSPRTAPHARRPCVTSGSKQTRSIGLLECTAAFFCVPFISTTKHFESHVLPNAQPCKSKEFWKNGPKQTLSTGEGKWAINFDPSANLT